MEVYATTTFQSSTKVGRRQCESTDPGTRNIRIFRDVDAGAVLRAVVVALRHGVRLALYEKAGYLQVLFSAWPGFPFPADDSKLFLIRDGLANTRGPGRHSVDGAVFQR